MAKPVTPKNITVLMGGWNGEREVSLDSAKDIIASLKELGHNVKIVDVKRNLPDIVKSLDPKPDVVFNAMHGRWVEDGMIQGILEIMEIPYTHSNVLSSAVAMEKPFAKAVLDHAADLPVIEGKVVDTQIALSEQVMDFPYILKPTNEGSSIGVHIINSLDDLKKCDSLKKYKTVMAEKFIPGRELSVAVMGDKALGVLELEPTDGFYDYEHKYTDGKTVHHMPARISKEEQDKLRDIALKAHHALGCQGVSRTDFRYDDTNGVAKPYILEVNTQPGMTPLSIVPEIAGHEGITYTDLVQWMVENARCPD